MTVVASSCCAAAVASYEAATKLSIDMGRFAMAAKQLMTMAEINENQLSDLDAALNAYQQVCPGRMTHSDPLWPTLTHSDPL